MITKKHLSYALCIIGLLLIWMLPPTVTESLRCHVISLITYLPNSYSKTKKISAEEILQTQCVLLKSQNKRLEHLLLSEKRIEERLKEYKELTQVASLSLQPLQAFWKRRLAYNKMLLDLELQGLPCKVIYRDPTFWSTALWVNLGEKDNKTLSVPIISINSPVLMEGSLIGMIDYVGEKQSRVRLITDPALTISVRATRGHHPLFFQDIKLLCEHVLLQNAYVLSEREKTTILTTLNMLKEKIQPPERFDYLGKGELRGAADCFLRGVKDTLKGVGFNYDFPDPENNALPLKTSSSPLVQVGDVLVTTGMDSIFPADLPVAIVSKVFPLEDGTPWHTIEAKLCKGSLNEIDHVMVLPALDMYTESCLPSKF